MSMTTSFANKSLILNSKDLTNSNVKNFLNLDLNSQQNNDEIKLLN